MGLQEGAVLHRSPGAVHHGPVFEYGLQLANTPFADGGFKEYFSEHVLPDGSKKDLRIKDPFLRASTAIMLHNAKEWLGETCRWRRDRSTGKYGITETTRSALVGGFSDYLFPIIRAAFPTNLVNELVSVQPTTRKIATVAYWNWIVATAKGTYQPGQRLFDANTGVQTNGANYTSELILGEALPAGAAVNGTTAAYSATLAFADGGGIRPGTVALTLNLNVNGTAADVIFADNGAGTLVATAALPGSGGTISSATINYATGAVAITAAHGTAVQWPAVTTNKATYRYDSEGSAKTPQVDIQITTQTVQTERRALRFNYSTEAQQDLMAEFGAPLEPNLVSGGAEWLNYEISRQIISDLFRSAAVVATHNLSPASGSGGTMPLTTRIRDLLFAINSASNTIHAMTQKAMGNWLVVDNVAATVIQSMDSTLFQAAPPAKPAPGLVFLGTLNGQYRVYKDIFLQSEPNAVTGSGAGNILMGYKGTDFFEAGYVWCPYQLMYLTNTLQTADFLNQKGMASRYGTKMLNPAMYVRINLSNASL